MRYSFGKCAAIGLVAAGLIFAQNPKPEPQSRAVHAQGHGCGMWGHMDVDHVAQVLNLTEPQKEQARTIFEQMRQSAQPVRQELKQNREKLMAAAKVANNESAIQKLAMEQGRLMGKLIAIRTEGSAKFYQVLTPEQRVKSDQMHEQWRQKMRSKGPGSDLE